MLIHTGEKTFACNQCDKMFSLYGILKRHKLTHFGIKLFACDQCDKTFKRSVKRDLEILAILNSIS